MGNKLHGITSASWPREPKLFAKKPGSSVNGTCQWCNYPNFTQMCPLADPQNVLLTPRLHVIYWVGTDPNNQTWQDPAGIRQAILDAATSIGGSTNGGTTTQYWQGTPRQFVTNTPYLFVDSFEDHVNPRAVNPDGSLANTFPMIQYWAQAKGWGYGDIAFVAHPYDAGVDAGTSSICGSNTGGAYNGVHSIGLAYPTRTSGCYGGSLVDDTYANAVHEIVESITDPKADGWGNAAGAYQNGGFLWEIGDNFGSGQSCNSMLTPLPIPISTTAAYRRPALLSNAANI